jgi:Domain of unknown function (DUF4173)
MSLSRPALVCAIGCAVVAGIGVAQQRVGLALTMALVLAIAAGVLGARRRASRIIVALAIALALGPLLRDAGWVVAIDAAFALVAAAAAVGVLIDFRGMGRALIAPLRLVGGAAVVGRAVGALRPARPLSALGAIARGLGGAVVLLAVFGALFVTGDRAFGHLIEQTFTFKLDGPALLWRVVLAVAFAAVAGAIARAGARDHDDERAGSGLFGAPGRTELVIALGAVVALFAAFVAVQLRVLFGGARYVQATTGLGYGDYARQGFVQLLVVAALTLALVGFAARRRDRAVRGLLGALCVLTLVVLVSAYHRLDLVEQAYGLTRVRYAGDAVVFWLAALFALVLAAGCSPWIARRLPRIATILTLGSVLAFSLSNPDARIADSAVHRVATGGPLDIAYLRTLSADALPALQRLPPRERRLVVPALRARLARPDGIAGLNLARANAR